MTILSRIKNRYTILSVFLIIAFGILAFNVAELTIVNGEDYRVMANNKITKELPIVATRGPIKDAYGRNLAVDRLGYDVHILKNQVIDDRLNDVALNLIQLLESNGDKYIDKFPILLDPIRFTFQEQINEWKIRQSIDLDADAKEAFEILKNRHKEEIERRYIELSRRDPKEFPPTPFEEMSDGTIQYLLVYYIEETKDDLPISISRWEFRQEIEENNWKEKWPRKIDLDASAEESFNFLRERFQISPQLSDEQARKILVVRQQMVDLGYWGHRPVEIAKDVSQRSRAQIEEMNIEFPGVSIEQIPIRNYPMGTVASHIIGHLGTIPAAWREEYVDKRGYKANSIIGREGIEYQYEFDLAGTDGRRIVEVNAGGRIVRELDQFTVNPIPGDTVFLTIDAEIQSIAEQALENNMIKLQTGELEKDAQGKPIYYPNAVVGSLVAINVKTGEIIAMVSKPDFDPNLFKTGSLTTQAAEMLYPKKSGPLDPKPMFNQAIKQPIPPGSTYKMIGAITGLDMSIINERTTFNCTGIFEKYNKACWIYNRKTQTGRHGSINIYAALSQSCNLFFFEIGERAGVEPLIEYAQRFELGELTGVELPGERRGSRGNPESKLTNVKAFFRRDYLRPLFVNLKAESLGMDRSEVELTQKDIEDIDSIIALADTERPLWNTIYRTIERTGIVSREVYEGQRYINKLNEIATRVSDYVREANWRGADTADAYIGQGGVEYTPLQMANYTAILASKGVKQKVHIVKKIVGHDGEIKYETPVGEIGRVELNNPRSFDIVNKAMFDYAQTGTSRFRGYPIQIAGKTGTAEYSIYENFGWFVGFAPYNDPEIAVAVVIYQSGWGYNAIPAAKEVVEAYLTSLEEREKVYQVNRLVK